MRDLEVGDAHSSMGSVVTSNHWIPEHKLPATTILAMITGSGYREQFVPQIVKNFVMDDSMATPMRSKKDILGAIMDHVGTMSQSPSSVPPMVIVRLRPSTELGDAKGK